MFRHPSIEFVYRGEMNGAVTFPSHNLFSQILAQLMHGFDRLLGTG
jgi:hypothetical protein